MFIEAVAVPGRGADQSLPHCIPCVWLSDVLYVFVDPVAVPGRGADRSIPHCIQCVVCVYRGSSRARERSRPVSTSLYTMCVVV
jgi:hypothetical protein